MESYCKTIEERLLNDWKVIVKRLKRYCKTSDSGSRDAVIQASMDPGIHESRNPWIPGLLDSRIPGSMDPWITGPLEQLAVRPPSGRRSDAGLLLPYFSSTTALLKLYVLQPHSCPLLSPLPHAHLPTPPTPPLLPQNETINGGVLCFSYV